MYLPDRNRHRWLNVDKYGEQAKQRWKEREKAIAFFGRLYKANCEHIAIENPIGCMSTALRKPDQIISPWMFGDNVEKRTCLWLKGLPLLVPIVEQRPEMGWHEWTTPDGRQKRQNEWYYQTRCLPHADRARAASKTFPGIAKAMAEQWAGNIDKAANLRRCDNGG